jgi:hypothetical protein
MDGARVAEQDGAVIQLADEIWRQEQALRVTGRGIGRACALARSWSSHCTEVITGHLKLTGHLKILVLRFHELALLHPGPVHSPQRVPAVPTNRSL